MDGTVPTLVVMKHYKYPKFGATSNGDIYNFNRRRFVGQSVDGSGYYKINIFIPDGKDIVRQSHRFIYECFYGEISKGYVIDHIDNNKLNNNIINLQAITPSHNSQKNCNHINTISNSKRILAINLNTGLKYLFKSAYQCQQYHGISRSSIHAISKGERYRKSATSKTDGDKYRFEYII